MCGWPFGTARKLKSGLPAFRVINNLVNMPGSRMCDKCLPLERAVVLSVRGDYLSGDELGVDEL